MSAHTPAPWGAFDNGFIRWISAGGYKDLQWICQFNSTSPASNETPEQHLQRLDLERANANRLVECVNACEGLADPKAFIDAATRIATQFADDDEAIVALRRALNLPVGGAR